MAIPKSNDVLSTEIESMKEAFSDLKTTFAKELGELRGKFDTFQSNFVRNDIFLLRYDELVKTHAEALVRLERVEKYAEVDKSEHDQFKGAIKLLRGGLALLTVIAAIIGALWWVKG